MIQKVPAMGNWWLAASSWQHTCSCTLSHGEFFGKISNHPGDSVSIQLRFVTLWLLFWLFAKLKSPLKGKRFQTINDIQENTIGNWWRLGELCEVPRCLLWRGLWCQCPMCNVSCIFFNKWLHFSYYAARCLLGQFRILWALGFN